MKALKLPPNAQHIVLLEDGDRFVQLDAGEAAIVLNKQEEGDIKVTLHCPNLQEGEEVPLNVMLAACVQEFLYDSDWVKEAQQRMQQKSEKKANKGA